MTGRTDFVIEVIFSPSRDLLRLDGLSKLLKGSARVVWTDLRLYLHSRWRVWRKMEGDNWLEIKQNWMSSCRIVELSGVVHNAAGGGSQHTCANNTPYS